MSGTAPVTHIDDVQMMDFGHGEGFAARLGRIGPVVGMEKLGCMLSIVPPGKTAFPRHNHHAIEEAIIVLEGEGDYCFGEDRYPVRAGSVMAAPAGGRERAHQLVNTGSNPLKYLCFSTMDQVDIVEYPDSNKVAAARWSDPEALKPDFMHRAYAGEPVDYWEGEE